MLNTSIPTPITASITAQLNVRLEDEFDKVGYNTAMARFFNRYHLRSDLLVALELGEATAIEHLRAIAPTYCTFLPTNNNKNGWYLR
jgi:hypothetical protein